MSSRNGIEMIVWSLIWCLALLGSVDGVSSHGSNEKKAPGSSEKTETTGKKTVWTPEMDQITCCNGGTPTMSESLVRNFTIIPADYTIEERTVDDVTMSCRDYEVRYLAQRTPVLSDADSEFDSEIKLKCKCVDSPPHILDANCRRLQSCKNNGFRSSDDPHQCVCPHPFFGERCEKYCDQGQRLKSHSGRDYCSCVPFYEGEECREMICLNGGHEDNGRCVCLQQFLGFHCEINTNHTGGSRFQRFGDQGGEMFSRDVSGTIFSLIMIVVLVVSMYLLMKHRMQTRYLNRRSDLLGACNFPLPASMTVTSGPGSNGGCMAMGRRADLMSADDPRLYSFRPVTGTLPVDGPPPYFQHRGRRGNREVLPPLPTYEDATKLPPLRNNIMNEESAESGEETTELSTRSTQNESSHPSHGTNEQVPSTAPESFVATVRGNEMVRPVTTISRPVDSSSLGTQADENAETMSIQSSSDSSSVSSSATSDASSKP